MESHGSDDHPSRQSDKLVSYDGSQTAEDMCCDHKVSELSDDLTHHEDSQTANDGYYGHEHVEYKVPIENLKHRG